MATDSLTDGKERSQKLIYIREFDPEKDVKKTEVLERRCEVGPSDSFSLYTDLMGDPVCRIRHCPAYIMLVAEYGAEREMVGLIRGSIKAVVCGNKQQLRSGEKQIPLFANVAYILGLRVSPTHRRLGIGLSLVRAVEEWFRRNGADYAYMATENDNEASLKLFVEKCGFTKFRTPALLVHPVHSHSKRISNRTNIHKLDVAEAERFYRECMGTAEFFPKDIDAVLSNKLSLGTWVAVPRAEQWRRPGSYGATPGCSTWAIISVWNTSEVFKMCVKGVRMATRVYAATSRLLDRALPWFKIPSVPDVFHSFGVVFLYGVHAEGPRGGELMNHLCRFAHNLAKDKGCQLIATEIGGCDPLKQYIPQWDCFSCPEDLWCIKKLASPTSAEVEEEYDWSKSAPGVRLFVDPREF